MAEDEEDFDFTELGAPPPGQAKKPEPAPPKEEPKEEPEEEKEPEPAKPEEPGGREKLDLPSSEELPSSFDVSFDKPLRDALESSLGKVEGVSHSDKLAFTPTGDSTEWQALIGSISSDPKRAGDTQIIIDPDNVVKLVHRINTMYGSQGESIGYGTLRAVLQNVFLTIAKNLVTVVKKTSKFKLLKISLRDLKAAELEDIVIKKRRFEGDEPLAPTQPPDYGKLIIPAQQAIQQLSSLQLGETQREERRDVALPPRAKLRVFFNKIPRDAFEARENPYSKNIIDHVTTLNPEEYAEVADILKDLKSGKTGPFRFRMKGDALEVGFSIVKKETSLKTAATVEWAGPKLDEVAKLVGGAQAAWASELAGALATKFDYPWPAWPNLKS